MNEQDKAWKQRQATYARYFVGPRIEFGYGFDAGSKAERERVLGRLRGIYAEKTETVGHSLDAYITELEGGNG